MKLADLNALPVHPSANEFPMLDDDAFHALCEDIATHGMVDAIVLIETSEGLALLDGRNRLRAANSIGLDEVATTVWRGDDPTSFVISTNIHRRHLSLGQKAFLVDRFEDQYKDEAAERRSENVSLSRRGEFRSEDRRPHGGWALTRASELLGVGIVTAQRMRVVKRETPELADKVWAGELSVASAYSEYQRRQKAQRDKVAQWDRHRLAQTDPAAYAEKVFADGVMDRLDKAIDLLADVRRDLKKAAVRQEFLDTLQGRFNKIADLIDSAATPVDTPSVAL